MCRAGSLSDLAVSSDQRERAIEMTPAAGPGRCWWRLAAAGVLTICLCAATLAVPAAVSAVCTGDCNGDAAVTVDDLLTMVNVALDNTTVDHCSAGDANGDHAITIDEILTAVNYALTSCPVGTPASLVTGDYALNVAADARSFTLSRRAEVLLSFPADALQLGTVDSLDERSSYDPYFLEAHGPLFPAIPPASLKWRKVNAASIASAAADSIVLHLGFDDGRSATLTLSVARSGTLQLPRSCPIFCPLTLRRSPGYGCARAPIRREAFYGLGEWEDDVNSRGKSRPMQIEIRTGHREPLQRGSLPDSVAHRHARLGPVRREPARRRVRRRHARGAIWSRSPTARRSKAATGCASICLPPSTRSTSPSTTTTSPAIRCCRRRGRWGRGSGATRTAIRRRCSTTSTRSATLDLATSAIWIDRPYATAVNTLRLQAQPVPRSAEDDRRGARQRVAHGAVAHALRRDRARRAAAQTRPWPTITSRRPPGCCSTTGASRSTSPTRTPYAWWQGLDPPLHRHGHRGLQDGLRRGHRARAPGARNVWEFADGSDERTMHYGYTLLYHQVYAETLPAVRRLPALPRRPLGRSTQRSVIWPGDMDATFTRHGEPTSTHGGQTERSASAACRPP